MFSGVRTTTTLYRCPKNGVHRNNNNKKIKYINFRSSNIVRCALVILRGVMLSPRESLESRFVRPIVALTLFEYRFFIIIIVLL